MVWLQLYGLSALHGRILWLQNACATRQLFADREAAARQQRLRRQRRRQQNKRKRLQGGEDEDEGA